MIFLRALYWALYQRWRRIPLPNDRDMETFERIWPWLALISAIIVIMVIIGGFATALRP